MRDVFWENQRCKIGSMKLREKLRKASLPIGKRETFKQIDAIQISNVAGHKESGRHTNDPQDCIRKEPFVEDDRHRSHDIMGIDEEGFSSALLAVTEQHPPRASHELRLLLLEVGPSFLQVGMPRR
jgi:hypothetical protein